MPKIVAVPKMSIPYLYTSRRTIAYAYTLLNAITYLYTCIPILIYWLGSRLHILIHALLILKHWVGFRLSAPYLNTCITYLNTLSRLSAPCLNTLPTRQPIRIEHPRTLGRIEYYVTWVVSRSEWSITSPESSRRLEDPSRLESAHYSLS